MRNGLNKILNEKRKQLGLSLKEASKLLSYNKTHLRLIEEGYLPVSRKKEKVFIEVYKLDENFFNDDYGYPVILKEEEVKFQKQRFYKIINSLCFKISCFVLFFVFAGLTIGGGIINSNIKTKTSSCFESPVNETKLFVKQHADKTTNRIISEEQNLGDVVYELNNDYDSDKTDSLSIKFADKEKNILFTFLTDEFKYNGVFPGFFNKNPINIKTLINGKYLNGSLKLSASYYYDEIQIGSVASTINDDIKINNVKLIGDNNKLIPIKENENEFYTPIVELFKSHFDRYNTQMSTFFNSEHFDSGRVSYDSFNESFKKGTSKYASSLISSLCMLIFGLVFSVFFLALAVLYIFKKMPQSEQELEDVENSNVVENTQFIVESKVKEKPLKKNLRIAPLFPGNLLKFVSISMIFAYSIGFFFIFINIITHNEALAAQLKASQSLLSTALIIAFLLLFFVKLDLIQSRKNYFITNYFYFFAGLAFYGLMLVISYSVAVDNTVMSKLGQTIINVIPGNFLWGILAFNMMVLILFYNPVTIGNDKKKMMHYRLLSLIPISYLIISLILEIGTKCSGWQIPNAISCLFFTKSVDLIIFALGYTLFAYFYKRWTIKRYGTENASLFQKGNAYYFTKNIAAALIVLIIGIVEITCHFACPNNALGLGEDYLIMCTIPFILLYHPHHGKRNTKIDNLFLAFYIIAYAIGIALILISLIMYIINLL